MSTAIRILQGSFGRVALLDMDKPLVTHAHHHCHILIKASGADTYFTVRDAMQPLTDRSAVLVNAWEPHAYAHHREGGPRTVILALYIDCAWLANIHKPLAVASHPHFFLRPCVALSPTIRERADELAAEMLCRPQIPQDHIEQQLYELVISVLDPFSEWRNAAGLFRAGLPHPQDRRIKRAIRFMREHLGEELDMGELARQSALSRAHFFALFRRCTKLTPQVYLNALRMEAAIDGLTSSEAPVAGLACRLGFSAQSHFSRFFRQHQGITPTDYRCKAIVYAPVERTPLA